MTAPNITHDLAEARERADAGIRLAMPEFAARVGIGAPPPPVAPVAIDPETAHRIGSHLAAARAELFEALKKADATETRTLHVQLLTKVADLDNLAVVLGEWSLI